MFAVIYVLFSVIKTQDLLFNMTCCNSLTSR